MINKRNNLWLVRRFLVKNPFLISYLYLRRKEMDYLYKYIFLGILLLSFSCNRSNRSQSFVCLPSKDSIIELDFTYDYQFDTITYDNIIKSVYYIPLETTPKSMLGKGDIIVRKVAGNYIVSTGECQFLKIKEFDKNGKYVRDIFDCEKRQNQLIEPLYWLADDSTKRVAVMGRRKIIMYDLQKDRYSEANVKEVPYRGALLDNCTFVINQLDTSDPLSGTSRIPYIYFFNLRGRYICGKYYNIDRDISFRPIPGVTVSPFEQYILKQTSYGAVFKDMYSDTIYSIRSQNDIHPFCVVNRGEYKPTIDEVHDSAEEKTKKIYIVSITDSREHLFVSYMYDNDYYTAVWNKDSQKLIAKTKLRKEEYNNSLYGYYCYMPFSFDDFEGILPIDYITEDNKIYVGAKTSILENVVPNIKRGDNPVIIEITLK